LESFNGGLGWIMQYKFFFLIYYKNGDYVGMELKDWQDHIRSLGNQYFQDFHDNKVATMMAQKQILVDHHHMIINLKKNLQECDLSSQLEGMSCLLNVSLFDKDLVSFGVEINFK